MYKLNNFIISIIIICSKIVISINVLKKNTCSISHKYKIVIIKDTFTCLNKLIIYKKILIYFFKKHV